MTGSRSTEYYPLFLDVAGREVVIVGGGAVSARKAATMLHHGAKVTVVAPEITTEIAGAQLIRKSYEAADLENAFLVFAATNDPAVNGRVAEDCRARRILVSVADAPALGDFIVPAIVESGPIRIAVSTSGSSPALARRLKDELQPFAELAQILGELRESAIASLPDAKPFFESLVHGGILELLREGKRDEAEARVRQLCEDAGVRRE
ncbi:MAG TPA: bifunctional precorrin-2 dehydrogenase/sirohydrochlorin ferrochelatase [Thermoanaerobaculia bacterium]|nr:bifunctional precorrin-2 dehydrogenase/sirohydrochlorin ferrochelatase [Thermoanaerobaculia bacterium]